MLGDADEQNQPIPVLEFSSPKHMEVELLKTKETLDTIQISCSLCKHARHQYIKD